MSNRPQRGSGVLLLVIAMFAATFGAAPLWAGDEQSKLVPDRNDKQTLKTRERPIQVEVSLVRAAALAAQSRNSPRREL